jgi:hypothetical protein
MYLLVLAQEAQKKAGKQAERQRAEEAGKQQ